MNHDHHESETGRDWKMRIVFFAFLAIAGFFLLTEHRAHVFGILPFVLLLACPLMHLFGHHGHGGGHHTDPGARRDSEQTSPPPKEQHP